MIYILIIAFIIAIASVFGYILWNLNIDVEVIEEYMCETIADLETEIQMLKEKNNDQSQDNDF